MRDYTKLKAFTMADELALFIYEITRLFPKEEVYGLVSQMRRAAVSIPSNIVEGCAHESQREFQRFIEIAFGSARELRYQFSIAVRLGYVKAEHIAHAEPKLLDVEKVLGALVRSLRPSPA